MGTVFLTQIRTITAKVCSM